MAKIVYRQLHINVSQMKVQNNLENVIMENEIVFPPLVYFYG